MNLSETRLSRMRAAASQRIPWIRVAAEHVHHRHNTSALLRSCDAFGILDVHAVGEHTFVPSRPERGVSRWMRVHPHQTAEEAIAAVRAAGLALWVADLSDRPVPPEDVPLDRPLCLWFGSELLGVCPEARAAADGVVTLPMRGMGQSLNLAAAATAVLYTLTRRALREQPGAVIDPGEAEALLASWVEASRRE